MKDIALKYGCPESSVSHIISELTIRNPKIIKIPATAEAVTGKNEVKDTKNNLHNKYSSFYNECQVSFKAMSKVLHSIYEGLDENEKRIWELGMINAEINNLRRNNDERSNDKYK